MKYQSDAYLFYLKKQVVMQQKIKLIFQTIQWINKGIFQARTHLPTKSLLGPTAIEFQFHETCEGQFVKPSQCLLVNTTYLWLETQV